MTETKKHFLKAIRQNAEGRVFIFGVVSTCLFTLFLLSTFLWTEIGEKLISLAALRIAMGRSGGLYSGFVMGLHPGWVFGINLVVEVLWILLIAPLGILAMKKILDLEWIKRYLDKRQDKMLRYQNFLSHHGTVTLFAFVAIPLPLSGPIIGSLIADQLKFSLVKNFTVVTLAAFVSVLFWSFLIYFFNDWVSQYGRMVQWSMLGVMVVITLIVVAVSSRHK